MGAPSRGSHRGGPSVVFVNDQIGNNANLWTPYNTMQTRPLSGVYIGAGVGSTGIRGWYERLDCKLKLPNATTNANDQSYGIVLGTGVSTGSYTVYGTDLYGNLAARVGQQASGGTGATTIVP